MGRSFQSIDSGPYYTCGLREDDSITCWGQGGLQGELTSPPVGSFVSVTTGGVHQCALEQDGTPSCWGSQFDRDDSAPADERFSSLSSGLLHSCGLQLDSTVTCWGYDHEGQSSPPGGRRYDPDEVPEPTIPDPDETFSEVALRYYHSCALATDGTAYCWGGKRSWSGRATPTTRGSPRSRRDSRTAAVSGSRDGSAVCWGSNHDGRASPPVDRQYIEISTGRSHTCALRVDGSPECWGGKRKRVFHSTGGRALHIHWNW